jgi:hypothetical protein
MIENIKIQNILDIVEIKKSMEPNKCILIKNKLWKYLFKCFLWLLKVQWVYKMVPPKDGFAFVLFLSICCNILNYYSLGKSSF